jgi:hypothetical protein
MSGLLITNNSTNPTTETVLQASSIVVTNGTLYTTLYGISGLVCNSGVVGAGGLSTDIAGGSISGLQEVYEHLIWNGTTVSTLFSASPTAPALPTGYTYWRYVGAIPVISNVFPIFVKNDRRFTYDAAQQISTGTAAQNWTTQNASAFMAGTTKGLFEVYMIQTGATVNYTAALRKHGSSSTTGHPMGEVGCTGGTSYSTMADWIDTDGSQNIDLYIMHGISGWTLHILGFEEIL